MSNILITGATGFIGGFLVEEAISRGHKVFATVRSSSNTQYLDNQEVALVPFDFSDKEAIGKVLSDHKIDIVINNAGLTRAKSQQTLDRVNAEYLKNLCLAIRNCGSRKPYLLHISSLAALGPAELTPNGIVTNDTAPHPVTMYGRSKLKGERILKEEFSDLGFSILRPTAVYGPREKDLYTVFKSVNSRVSAHIGKGNQKLTFIYVKDLVRMMVIAAEKQESHSEYNVGDGKTYSTKELNKLIKESLGKKVIVVGVPLTVLSVLGHLSEYLGRVTGKYPTLNIDKVNEIKAQSWNFDATSTHLALGYTPQYLLSDGVNETVKWYKDNGWLK